MREKWSVFSVQIVVVIFVAIVVDNDYDNDRYKDGRSTTIRTRIATMM